jgi:signal transduction histidine kinase/CheY-like chemotaxis protein
MVAKVGRNWGLKCDGLRCTRRARSRPNGRVSAPALAAGCGIVHAMLDAIEPLYAQALRQRGRDPAALVALAEQMRALQHRQAPQSMDEALALGRTRAVLVWGLLARNPPEPVARVSAAFDDCFAMLALAGLLGAALANDLRSLQAQRQGHFEDSLAHALAALAQRDPAPPAIERCFTMARVAAAQVSLRRFDDALQSFYSAIEWCDQCGELDTGAATRALAGGLQVELGNLEDGAVLSDQAWQHLAGGERSQSWVIAAVNRVNSLGMQARHAEAGPLVSVLVPLLQHMQPRLRGRSYMTLAMARAWTGDDAGAQALLDEALLDEQAAGGLPAGLSRADLAAAAPGAWAGPQAVLWNRQGRHAEAAALCRVHLARPYDGGGPVTRACILSEAVRAAEGLGDLGQALVWQREALAQERQLNLSAARTRRITLQIQFDLKAARAQRDLAVQREQAAHLEQERLAELNQRLDDASRAKTRFLAAASHDLRQPLHALALLTAHLEGLPGLHAVPEAEPTLGRMDRALGSLITMFDTLLDISRMDAGAVRPRPERLALRPLLARLADEAAAQAAARGLRLRLHAADAGWCDSDPALLESILRNLLSNALKYTATGSVLLALRRRGGHWCVEVWDSGPGIAPAHRQRVFEEFYRVGGDPHEHREHREESLGLGLAIVRRLALLLGHGLRLESQVGRGSRFTLDIVAAAAVTGLRGAPAQPSDEPARLTVGVVDDDPDLRASLALLLRGWGHEPVQAEHVDALWMQPAAARLDALVVDWRLGSGRTGAGEAARVRDCLGADLPVLVITGETGPDALRALDSSGLTWLPKPLRAGRLRSWVAGLRPRC